MAANLSVDRVFRKSFVAYIRWFLGVLIWVGIPLAVGLNRSGTLRTVLLLVALFFVARRIYLLFLLRSIRWEVREDGLFIGSGILPWRRGSFLCPYETIFEAVYNRRFLGHFLHYGTVSIRRAEGVTSAMSESYMNNGLVLVTLVSERLAGLRAAMKPTAAPAMTLAPAGVGDLAELARLKASGDITAEEYELMKSRIIGAAPESVPAVDPI
jgi:hypothetical protein